MRTRVAAVLVVATWLGGCSTEPIVLRGDDLGRPQVAGPRPRNPALPLVVVDPVADARGADSAGMVAGRKVSLTGLESYLDVALAAPAAGFDVARQDDPALATSEAPALRVRARILKAYVASLGTSKSAVVVTEATFVRPDGSTTVSTFRAQDVGVNWASGSGEVAGAFRTSARSCADQIRAVVSIKIAAQ